MLLVVTQDHRGKAAPTKAVMHSHAERGNEKNSRPLGAGKLINK